MLEFEVVQELQPNNEILEVIKNYTFTTKNGKDYGDGFNRTKSSCIISI